MTKFRMLTAACAAVALITSAGVVLAPSRAVALAPGLAFSADALSSWQVDGVAYAVASAGRKVIVGGAFANLRPPEGSGSQRPLPGLAILDADTGEPADCQLPAGLGSGTATVYALNASPDGHTVYVGGNFSSIGGVSVSRVAAIDIDECEVLGLRAQPSSIVYGLTSTASTVYLAGLFSAVDGEARGHFAAIDATTGDLLEWRADSDLTGRAVAVSPDGSKVALGGEFFAINSEYSHSIAVVDGDTGQNLQTFPKGFIDDQSVTKTIVSDNDSFYVGNEGTGGGVFDGRIAIGWSTLTQRWRDTCLGATQAVLPYHGTLYSANHVHNCRSMKYFPDGTRKYFLAQSTTDGSLRAWTPEANDGIGERIGTRALAVANGAGGAAYLYVVGEFTKINGRAQQGITRFGQTDTGAPPVPALQVEALRTKALQVRIWTSVDNDDATLTYRVYRDGGDKPVWTGTATSWWWTQPQITFVDKAVTTGRTYTYRATVSDGTNTSDLSVSASAKVTSTPPAYPRQVIADGAQLYWRFDEPSGNRTWHKGADSPSSLNGRLGLGTQLGAKGAISGNTAAHFDGVNDYAWNDQLRIGVKSHTIEAWFKTKTTSGGKIIGFTNGRPRTDDGNPTPSTAFDRQIYMEDGGRLDYGVWTTTKVVLRSPKSYNDGRWHHVVARQGSSGMALFVDGHSVAHNSVTKSKAYYGVWKVGGDSLAGWARKPSSDYFLGDIDEVAVYQNKALSSTAIAKHYKLAGKH